MRKHLLWALIVLTGDSCTRTSGPTARPNWQNLDLRTNGMFGVSNCGLIRRMDRTVAAISDRRPERKTLYRCLRLPPVIPNTALSRVIITST